MKRDKIDDNKTRGIVYKKYDGRCAYCGCFLNGIFTIDHIKPKLRHKPNSNLNGEDTLKNYNPSCLSCNSSKGTLSIEMWRVEIKNKIGRLRQDSSLYRCVLRFGLVNENNNKIKFYFEK